MRLTMKEKQTVTKAAAERYQKAMKRQKGVILDEFVESTGYDRCYASYLLRQHGRKIVVSPNQRVLLSPHVPQANKDRLQC
ncbi:MAG: hypothetical protein HQK96_11810 [Nitrospirae bacterium]|nr:hypothetical protein [Nitrospirota bacterium]